MNLTDTVILGAIAGFTIFLGLPIARLRSPRPAWQAFLSAIATGILLFLLWDILSKAKEPIVSALGATKEGDGGAFVGLLALFGAGIALGLVGLVYLDRVLIRRHKVGAQTTPAQLALMIAMGIGVHNFSEGLAIGQASRSGALELATMLIVGFGLHNLTEGFGIAAPLTLGARRPSWAFLGLAGLIGGGPTFLGTILGYSVHSTPAFVLFLAVAAGSILYVVGELFHVSRRFQAPSLVAWGVWLGFVAGFGTDLLLTWAGA
jgi:ZIP family zinc transporter